MSARRACRCAGLLTIASVVWFAAGLLPWWAPIDGPEDSLRAFALIGIHFAGAFFGALSLDDGCWPNERKATR